MATRTQDFSQQHQPQQPLAAEPEEKHADSDDSSTKADAHDDRAASVATGPGGGNSADPEKKAALGNADKYEITEDDCYEELGFSYPVWKKWYILTIIFVVQVSMNFNTALYSNAIGGISEEFNVSEQAARCGAMIFLVMYAFGCELWAPWSEEFGRWPIIQLSLFLVNIWQLPVALAGNFATIMVGRTLGGLSTAGGSVTLGMIADMFETDDQQYAVAYGKNIGQRRGVVLDRRAGVDSRIDTSPPPFPSK